MPPKFSLQTVLDVRHSKVEALEIELGQLMQEKRKKRIICIPCFWPRTSYMNHSTNPCLAFSIWSR